MVFGAGAIGCLFTAVLKAAGAAPLIVVEPTAARREVARAAGADHALTPDEFAISRLDLLPQGADVVIDAVGSVLPAALEIATMGGRVVLFGKNSNARAPIAQVLITAKGLTVMGSYVSNFTFPATIHLVEGGQLQLGCIVSDVMTLDRTTEGLERLRSGAATKIVITP